MATEQIITEYLFDLNKLKAQITELEGKLTSLGQKGVDSQKKIEDATVKTTQATKKSSDEYAEAARKRSQSIDNEIKNIERLKDQLKKAFSVNDINTFNAAIKEGEGRIKTLKGEVDKSASASSSFSDKLKGVAGALGIVFAVGTIVNFTKEAVLLAAKAEGVEKAFSKLGRPELLSELRAATKGTLSDLELMSQAVKADKLGIPIDKFATFLKFAQQRARETGESVDYLVDAIVNGVGRQSVRVIDNLGISQVRVREEFGKTTDKMVAITNIIEGELAKQGNSADTTADKIDRFSASWENFKKKAGQAVVVTGGFVAQYFGDVANTFINVGQKLGILDKEVAKTTTKRVDDSKKISSSNKEEIETVETLRLEIKLKNDDLEKANIKNGESVKISKELIVLEEKLAAALGKTSKEGKAAASDIKKAKEDKKRADQDELKQLIKANEERVNKNTDSVKRQSDEELKIKGDALKEEIRSKKEADKVNEERKERDADKADKDRKDQIEQLKTAGVGAASDLADAINTIRQEDLQRRTEQELEALSKEEEAEFASIDKKKEKALSDESLTSEQRAAIEERFNKQKEIAAAKFARKETEIKKKAFEENKKLAIEEAFIKAAVATLQNLATYGFSPAFLIAEAATVVATAAEIAVINSRKFAKGTSFLTREGSPKGVDTIPIMANEGEGIIPTDKNIKYNGYTKAMIAGNLEDYIQQQNVMPALREHISKSKQIGDVNIANAMAASMALHNKTDEYLMARVMKKALKGTTVNIGNVGDFNTNRDSESRFKDRYRA